MEVNNKERNRGVSYEGKRRVGQGDALGEEGQMSDVDKAEKKELIKREKGKR